MRLARVLFVAFLVVIVVVLAASFWIGWAGR